MGTVPRLAEDGAWKQLDETAVVLKERMELGSGWMIILLASKRA